jgi:hypothetical protein
VTTPRDGAVLPPGLTAADFEVALRAFADALGGGAVLRSSEAAGEFRALKDYDKFTRGPLKPATWCASSASSTTTWTVPAASARSASAAMATRPKTESV